MHRDHTAPGRAGTAASDCDRGQTAQDFAVGIGLFLLAVAFVFGFVPQVVEPFETGVGASEAAQADRAGALIVGNLSVEDRPNELNHTATDRYFDGLDADELRNRTGLPFSARVNVTVRELSDDTLVSGATSTWAAGVSHREGREAASATRIVRTTGDQCDPGCRVVVRVW